MGTHFSRRTWIGLTIGASLQLTVRPHCGADDETESIGQLSADEVKRPVRFVWFPRFSSDSKWLLSAHGGWDANEGGDVIVWDVQSGKLVKSLPQPRGIRAVAWSPTGEFFLCGGYGSSIRFYETATGKLLHELKSSSQTEGLAVTADGKQFVSTHGNGNVVLWNLSDRKELKLWKGIHNGGIWGMTLSHDDQLLATAGQDKFVRVIDLTTNEIRHEFQHPQSANGVAFTGSSLFVRVVFGA